MVTECIAEVGAVAVLLIQEKNASHRRRLPDEDSLSLVKGFLGAYPNAYWVEPESQLTELRQRIASLAGESDYAELMDRFGVRRTNPRFWSLSDQAHLAMQAQERVGFGMFDYNRLQNR